MPVPLDNNIRNTTIAAMGVGCPVNVELKRVRFVLPGDDSQLLVVYDNLDEGGRYVTTVIPDSAAMDWVWADWEDQYMMLERKWRARFSG